MANLGRRGLVGGVRTLPFSVVAAKSLASVVASEEVSIE